MALATSVKQVQRPDNPGDGYTYPSGIHSDWQAVCTAPDAVESDSGVVVGGKVVKPSAIARAAQALFIPGSMCTQLLVALKYNSDVGTPTSPVVRVFGKDHEGIWHALRDRDGNDEVTLTVDTATDTVQSTDYKLTNPAIFDMEGSEEIIVGIQTAFAAGSGTADDSEILVKAV